MAARGPRRGATPAAPPVIEASELSVGYSDQPVHAPASFTVAAGQVACLVGPNGAGKSTLLRAVVGLLPLLAGKIAVLEKAPDEASADFRRAVAVVLDEDAWFGELTVAEHLRLVARGHGVPAADDVVDSELDAFGITALADVLPSTLSSGQKRRLSLASVFVRPRRLLVLDEPEQRLDVGARHLLAERLKHEKRSGTAILMATHDPDLVRQTGDLAVLLGPDASRVVAPEEALARLAGAPEEDTREDGR